MKRIVIAPVILMLWGLAAVSAQETSNGAVTGMTLSGSTGLWIVPDAQIGWDRAEIGLNLGYGIVWTGGSSLEHLPRFAFNMFRRVEISGLLQIGTRDVESGIIGTKVQIFNKEGASLALGGDFEIANSKLYTGDNAKIYASATYSGDFFDMPTRTSLTLGWQLLNAGEFSSQLLYGMGFSIGLFPEVLKNYLLWVTDFSNFSYSSHGAAVDADDRGALNTGLRFHPIKSGGFNLVIDIIGTDLLDTSRGISAAISGGFALKSDTSRKKLR